MIIVAGAGSPKTKKYISKKTEHCYHCNNDRKWILQKTQFFITLFFLPVAPYKTTYTYSCPICGNTIKLDKDTFEQKVRFESVPISD